MTALPRSARDLLAQSAVDLDGAPEAEFVVAPNSIAAAASLMDVASEFRLRVHIWGSGQHQQPLGIPADVVMSTSRLTSILAYEPDDLTVTVESGVTLRRLEDHLAERRQTAVLPETSGSATVGGIVAAAVSPFRRLRFGPIRDRMLGVVLATGDGRVVHGGGAVVKNVTGYDLPRLVTGSFGSLGLIGVATLKLWPEPIASATVRVDDAARAFGATYRPLAVLQDRDGSTVYLAGTEAQIASEIEALKGDAQRGLKWPNHPRADHVATLRVPPASVPAAVARLDPNWTFLAEHGVGLVTVAGDGNPLDEFLEMRRWAESIGGGLTIDHSSGTDIDGWGVPPSTVGLQRRIVAAFDPIGVSNPGLLPGGI